MVKSSLSSLLVAVEALQIVVEIGGPRAQESAEQSCVSREHRGKVDLPDPGHDQANSGHPLVEVGHDSGRAVGVVLRQETEVPKEFCNHETVEEKSYLVVEKSKRGLKIEIDKLQIN